MAQPRINCPKGRLEVPIVGCRVALPAQVFADIPEGI